MICVKILGGVGIAICLIAACSPSTTIIPLVTETTPADSDEPAPLPLSEPGSYGVGMRKYTITDPGRDDREVEISVWFPAVKPTEVDPDPRAAPYPLILSSTKAAFVFAPYLVSHGFTWVSVDNIDTYPKMNEQMIDQPLDILFALNQVASHPPEGLEGMIDAEHTGVTGYSFDGYNTLAMSGARLDPDYYLAQCPTPDAATKSILTNLSAFDCGPAGAWDEFAAHAGQAITTSDDRLWQPITDPRIRAVMPLAAEGWWLFGEMGLAAEDRPALMMAGTRDTLYPENALIFEHLGTPDKTMISFIDRDHMMIYDPKMVERMAHFMAAFFGYHLQGRQDYAQYFSPEFVGQYEDLAWGVSEQ